jgi:hypothetical protein
MVLIHGLPSKFCTVAMSVICDVRKNLHNREWLQVCVFITYPNTKFHAINVNNSLDFAIKTEIFIYESKSPGHVILSCKLNHFIPCNYFSKTKLRITFQSVHVYQMISLRLWKQNFVSCVNCVRFSYLLSSRGGGGGRSDWKCRNEYYVTAVIW